MKKLIICLLITSSILIGCGSIRGPQELDSIGDTDTSAETIEIVEAKPVPAPESEDSESDESVEPVEEVAEPEEPEIPESDRGTNTYSAYVPEIVTFELSDGVLTVEADNGSRFDWSNNAQGFSINYPVAEDCIWEEGWFGSDGFVKEYDRDYKYIKFYIENEQASYIELFEEYEDFEVHSPMGIYIEVTDGIVVRVYTVFS